MKKFLAKAMIPALTALITVLVAVPGEQGETALQVALEVLKGFILN